MGADQITVRIYGETYPLRTGEDAAYVEELARFVDARMREVAASGKVVTTSRIAVLAALHLADELFRARREREREQAETDRRVAGLADALEGALAAAARRRP